MWPRCTERQQRPNAPSKGRSASGYHRQVDYCELKLLQCRALRARAPASAGSVMTDTKGSPYDVDLRGSWVNQNGSVLSIDEQSDGQVGGRFSSRKGRAAKGVAYSVRRMRERRTRQFRGELSRSRSRICRPSRAFRVVTCAAPTASNGCTPCGCSRVNTKTKRKPSRRRPGTRSSPTRMSSKRRPIGRLTRPGYSRVC